MTAANTEPAAVAPAPPVNRDLLRDLQAEVLRKYQTAMGHPATANSAKQILSAHGIAPVNLANFINASELQAASRELSGILGQ